MLRYLHRGKVLPEDMATGAASQKMRRHYGVPYMQQVSCGLPAGVLLHQYYTGSGFAVGYDCYDVDKPVSVCLQVGTEALLLLYPVKCPVALFYGQKKMTVSPQQYYTLGVTPHKNLRLALLPHITRYFYILLPKGYIDTAALPGAQRIQSNKKNAKLIDEILRCDLQYRSFELFITARGNDLIRHYLSAQKRQKNNRGVVLWVSVIRYTCFI